MKLDAFLKATWDQYCAITPDAARVHSVLEARGERIINDHVAYRTFALPGISRDEIGAIFDGFGYRRHPEDLDFPEKKLRASYWLPETDGLPKIFVSELKLNEVSPHLRTWIQTLTEGKTNRKITAEDLLNPRWNQPCQYADYQKHYPESEYAAWTAAFGIRANHFTVSVNHLKTFKSLSELNETLQTNGFVLSKAGGLIKGTENEKLEQSSTKAQEVPWTFANGQTHRVPSCYYEFAKRYPQDNGELFEGFVPASADKIFESTAKR